MNYAVSSQNKGMQKFYICENAGLSSLSESVIEAHREYGRAGAAIEKTIEVECIGINELLAQIGFVPDIVSIDIEGEDRNVIQAWNFELYRPKILVAECRGRDVNAMMMSHGYILYTIMGANSIFVEKEWYEQKQAE